MALLDSIYGQPGFLDIKINPVVRQPLDTTPLAAVLANKAKGLEQVQKENVEAQEKFAKLKAPDSKSTPTFAALYIDKPIQDASQAIGDLMSGKGFNGQGVGIRYDMNQIMNGVSPGSKQIMQAYAPSSQVLNLASSRRESYDDLKKKDLGTTALVDVDTPFVDPRYNSVTKDADYLEFQENVEEQLNYKANKTPNAKFNYVKGDSKDFVKNMNSAFNFGKNETSGFTLQDIQDASDPTSKAKALVSVLNSTNEKAKQEAVQFYINSLDSEDKAATARMFAESADYQNNFKDYYKKGQHTKEYYDALSNYRIQKVLDYANSKLETKLNLSAFLVNDKTQGSGTYSNKKISQVEPDLIAGKKGMQSFVMNGQKVDTEYAEIYMDPKEDPYVSATEEKPIAMPKEKTAVILGVPFPSGVMDSFQITGTEPGYKYSEELRLEDGQVLKAPGSFKEVTTKFKRLPYNKVKDMQTRGFVLDDNSVLSLKKYGDVVYKENVKAFSTDVGKQNLKKAFDYYKSKGKIDTKKIKDYNELLNSDNAQLKANVVIMAAQLMPSSLKKPLVKEKDIPIFEDKFYDNYATLTNQAAALLKENQNVFYDMPFYEETTFNVPVTIGFTQEGIKHATNQINTSAAEDVQTLYGAGKMSKTTQSTLQQIAK